MEYNIKCSGVYNGQSSHTLNIAVNEENIHSLMTLFNNGCIKAINYDEAYDDVPECWWVSVPANSLRNLDTKEDGSKVITIDL